tara:strand:- start:1986 stop:2198 length:213 start_codon:yes stop_codon:yes gene_type:complete
MTSKLEELKAARDAAWVAAEDAWDAYVAVATCDAYGAARGAYYAALDAAWDAAEAAGDTYQNELNKTQEE